VSKERELASGALEGARRATGGAPEARPDGRGRWSAKRKAAAILRLLRGEDIETLSRELGVTAATLSGWREQFLVGGEANLKTRETEVVDEETQRLKSLVADLSIDPSRGDRSGAAHLFDLRQAKGRPASRRWIFSRSSSLLEGTLQ
jgi:transposase-like protein